MVCAKPDEGSLCAIGSQYVSVFTWRVLFLRRRRCRSLPAVRCRLRSVSGLVLKPLSLINRPDFARFAGTTWHIDKLRAAGRIVLWSGAPFGTACVNCAYLACRNRCWRPHFGVCVCMQMLLDDNAEDDTAVWGRLQGRCCGLIWRVACSTKASAASADALCVRVVP